MKQIHSIFTKAMLAALLTMTAQTAWAQNPILVTEVPVVDGGEETNWNKTSENYTRLVDGNTSTKYGISNSNPWVEFHYTNAFVPKAYILWTANDSNGARNPTTWTIKSKLNQNDQWTTIATVDNSSGNQLPMTNDTSTEFSLEGNTTAYRYFRFEATINGNNGFQLAELQFKKKIEDPNNLQDATITGINSRYLYTGSAINITPVVTTASGSALSLGTDFTATLGSTNVTEFPFSVTDEGDYTLTVTGTGTQSSGYYGSQTFNFYVVNCPEGLSIDNTYTKGQVGYFYVNMPTTDTKTINLPDGFTSSFKVYDDGGKGSNYSDGCNGTLVLTAPTGYVLQLSGNISADGGYDYLHVYDGSTTSSTKLLDKVSSPGGHYGATTTITTVTSSGQSMRLSFHSSKSTNYAGLDLTVTLLSTSTERNITVNNPATGGTVAPSKSTAKYEETITLTATPANGYVLSDVSATDEIGNNVDINWNTWTNSATFTMPVYAVTVTPTFINDLTSLSVNMPKKGTKTATIPSGVTSFKVYDDGGATGNYSDGCKGYLVLTAPEGYVLQLSGNISADGGYDYLTVYDGTYDGTIASGTILLNRECSKEKTIAPISSTSESMTLYFYSSDQNNYTGLDLTVTLVNNGTEYDINVNNPTTGGIIAASINGTSVTKALANKTITLTATPESNYLLSDVSVKDESNNAIAVDVNFCNNTATFTMPASAVTIAPTFTNTLTADGGLYINIPANSSKEVTIPAGVQSFKVYDDGGSGGNYSKNCNGTLVLTAPAGYVLQLSGNITTDNGYDLLTVYDGNGTSTKLIDAARSSSENTETAITTVTSSGQSMRIFFTSNEYYNYAGLDLTVTVVPITYTVSFQKNNNDATGTMEAQTHTYDAQLALTANSFEYTGHAFAGWATSADGDVVYTDEQSVSNLATTQGANVDLFAKWTVTEYTITYDLAGGSVATANPTTYTIESAAITLNNPTREGYAFAGWTGTDLDAATTTVTIAQGSTGDRSYTATWTPTFTGGLTLAVVENKLTATLDGTALTELSIPTDITVEAVVLDRSFTTGKCATIMLPFSKSVNDITGTNFYTFGGVTYNSTDNKWIATMNQVTGTLAANTPYLVEPTATTLTFTGGATLNTTGGGNQQTADLGSNWTFKGTYAYREWITDGANSEEIGKAYGFAGVPKTGIEIGDFVRVASGAKIRPMGCYLLWSDTPNAAPARRMTRGAAADELPSRITVRLVGSNGETTGIGELDTRTGEISMDGWWTLDGTRLSGKPAKKGLYINNGKKVVIK